jgi:hypothetical protein
MANSVYRIDPDGLGGFDVPCDMNNTPGRGWTIFQRRVDGSEDFYRNWADYETGFGNLSGEFWLGLGKIHRLSASGQNVLRVDLESFDNETAYAVYESFSVGNGSKAYILKVDNYSGNNKYIDINSLHVCVVRHNSQIMIHCQNTKETSNISFI